MYNGNGLKLWQEAYDRKGFNVKVFPLGIVSPETPGWHQQATFFELLINKDIWNGMSPKQQLIIEELCKAATLSSLAYCEAIQAPVLKENVEKHGVKNMCWSKEMLDAFEGAWAEVV